MTTDTQDSLDLPAQPVSDEKLTLLNNSLLEITDLLMYQIEQALHALDYCDTDLALKVIARDRKVNHYQIKIDAEVLMVLAEQRLIKSDLHTLILTGRIAIELEEIGNQLVEFTKHLMILFDLPEGRSRSRPPTSRRTCRCSSCRTATTCWRSSPRRSRARRTAGRR